MELILEYDQRMRKAGHKFPLRKSVIERAMVNFYNIIEKEKKGERKLYRSREEHEKEWKDKGGKPTSSNWFRRAGYDTTLSIPATREECLVQLVKAELEWSIPPKGIRTLCQEDGGVALKGCLVKSDPTGSRVCPRDDCQLCRREDIKRNICCWQTGSGYCVDCVRDPCLEESPGGSKYSKAKYQGETARTGYTRLKQHFASYGRDTIKAKEGSWMWEHTAERHGGIRGPDGGINDYVPKLTGTFRDPLRRTQDEGIRIKNDELDPQIDSLNRDSTYYKPEFIKFRWEK